MKWKWTRGFCSRNSPHQGGLVSREVVEDDVDLLPGRAEGDDFLQESDEVLTGVASGGFAVHAAGGRFQRGIERQRSVAVVLEAVTLGPSGRERQDGIEPIQGLNGGLFVDAEDGRMLGRVQIKADDVGRFGFRNPDRRWPCTAPGDAASDRLPSRRDARRPC